MEEVVYYRFAESPTVQLIELMQRGESTGDGAVSYLEYRFKPEECAGLSSGVPEMIQSVRSYLGTFDNDPVRSDDEFILGAVRYVVSALIGRYDTVRFAVSENSRFTRTHNRQ